MAVGRWLVCRVSMRCLCCSDALFVSLGLQGELETSPTQAFFPQQTARSRTPNFFNPKLHAVCIHLTLGVMMDDYAWWKLIFWLSFSLQNDHRLQFRSISQAGKTTVKRDFSWPVVVIEIVPSPCVVTVISDGMSNQTGVSSILPMLTSS